MFTGIITDIGTIRSTEQRGDLRCVIDCHYDTTTIDLGASIACSGVCLTVVEKHAHGWDVEVSAETLSKTNIGDWAVDERARAGMFLAFQYPQEVAGVPVRQFLRQAGLAGGLGAVDSNAPWCAHAASFMDWRQARQPHSAISQKIA